VFIRVKPCGIDVLRSHCKENKEERALPKNLPEGGRRGPLIFTLWR
jgi:hypothetical protein